MCDISKARIIFAYQNLEKAKHTSLNEFEQAELEKAEKLLESNIPLPTRLYNELEMLADRLVSYER